MKTEESGKGGTKGYDRLTGTKIMIEIKQLQYLIICADLQSFSRAADVLYTSQPSVSKTIRTLEEELGFSLFERQNRGIQLTQKGKQVYQYARKAIDSVERLASFARMDENETLMIACNPSSWISRCFMEFYRLHKEDQVSFQIITASTEEVIRRCGSGRSDVGFVYMMEPQRQSLQYRLERNHLEFVELKKVKAMLYFGMQNRMGQKKSIHEIPVDEIRLVQCYEDEFTLDHHWDLPCRDSKSGERKIRTAVITNSDYVMNDLLQGTDLGNISGEYLGPKEESQGYPGISLYGDETPVLFGYIVRKGERPVPLVEKFLSFIEEKMQ